jgi:hypothetical protein
MSLLARVLLSFTLPLAPQPEDPRLTEIRAELAHIRAEGSQRSETRGASPEFTAVKHQLRDWVESYLTQLNSDRNGADEREEAALASRLNAELKQAQVLCDAQDECIKDYQSSLGFVGQVQLEFKQRESFLILQTSLSIECGFDDSAYLYRWDQGRWKRIWQSEQNTYTKNGYTPQDIRAVLVSPSMNEGVPLVMTLGTGSWCTSNWRLVFVRLWRTNSEGSEPRLLLDKVESAYLGSHDIPIQGSVGGNDALVEFKKGSIDPDAGSYDVVWHYRVHEDKVERVDPVALDPRDFTDEWLNQPWEQSRLWSQPSSLMTLKQAHEAVSKGEFIQPTRHCRQHPDLWQVGFDRSSAKKSAIYFLVRWQPPYRFTMVQVLHHPSPDCADEDENVNEPKTLFPVQDWRE